MRSIASSAPLWSCLNVGALEGLDRLAKRAGDLAGRAPPRIDEHERLLSGHREHISFEIRLVPVGEARPADPGHADVHVDRVVEPGGGVILDVHRPDDELAFALDAQEAELATVL